MRTTVLGLLIGLGFGAACLTSQPERLRLEKVRDNLFVMTGSGGNTAVFVRGDGVVLVDTKLANDGQRILDQIRTVTDKPVTHILNTHTHADHVGSNSFFPASVEIVAHENTAGNMARMDAFKSAAAQHGLPDRSFKAQMALFSGRDAIDLYYFGAAHTGGDAFIVFRELRVMHAGDVFLGLDPPTVDVKNGGSEAAYSQTLANAAAGIGDVDTVIPGHGAVTTWQAFVDYRR